MKYVRVLRSIKLFSSDGEIIEHPPLSGIKFYFDRLTDSVFTVDFDSIARGMEIRSKLKELAVQAEENYQKDLWLELEDADWEKLVAACKKPSGGYNPTIAHNFYPLIEAVVNATGKAPV